MTKAFNRVRLKDILSQNKISKIGELTEELNREINIVVTVHNKLTDATRMPLLDKRTHLVRHYLI